jgi:acid phosphatase family membrane protein YuiD
MENSFFDLFRSPSFWSSLCAWLVAQLCKMLIGFIGSHRLDFRYLVSLGGMPSAHSAMASGLAVSVGLDAGFGSPVFATTLAFALIVMFDASTVRRAAGHQARLMNQMMDELLKNHKLSEEKLVEFLGHTPIEVFMGMLLGVFMALLINSV